jgi:hypothetical protein
MRTLTIIERAAGDGFHMLSHDLTIHIVHNPEMRVFARMGLNGWKWPNIVEHNGQQYQFSENLFMPEMAASNYSGYALYKMKEASK